MKRRILFTILAGMAALYVGDDLSVRYRIPRNRDAFGVVTIRRFDAISQKNNKTEYVYEEPTTVTCTHSLFPHFGYQPCWYLSRHADQRVNY
jgi:hypothetical protein